MAENLPVNFAIPGEGVIAAFNYTDIAEGTGIQVFYGRHNLNESGGNVYSLGTLSSYGNNQQSHFTASAISFTKIGIGFLGERFLIKKIFSTVFLLVASATGM